VKKYTPSTYLLFQAATAAEEEEAAAAAMLPRGGFYYSLISASSHQTALTFCLSFHPLSAKIRNMGKSISPKAGKKYINRRNSAAPMHPWGCGHL
jgi:hypothetical protein